MSYNQPQGYQQPMFQPQPVGHAQPQAGYPQIGYSNIQPGYQPHQAAPQAYVQQGAGAHKKMRGFEKLEARDGVFIKQKVDITEVVTGCEMENVYYVYSLGKDGEKKGKKLFKAKEKSGCCARQCMNGDCRPFKLKISTIDDSDEDADNEPFLLLDRPCKCTFLCCNRPEILVTYVEDGKNEYIGKIRDPWNCCNVNVDVHDKTDNVKYVIDGSCCQLGMICKCPCDSCQTVDFDIKTPSGPRVATLQKKSAGCIKSTVSDADNFSLFFPKGATKEDRALLMSAVLFLDFRYFEEKHEQSQSMAGK